MHGGDRSKSSNDGLKTREEMAEAANVSTPTIDRAKQVSRLGHSEEVISGEKSASAVMEEERLYIRGNCVHYSVISFCTCRSVYFYRLRGI